MCAKQNKQKKQREFQAHTVSIWINVQWPLKFPLLSFHVLHFNGVFVVTLYKKENSLNIEMMHLLLFRFSHFVSLCVHCAPQCQEFFDFELWYIWSDSPWFFFFLYYFKLKSCTAKLNCWDVLSSPITALCVAIPFRRRENTRVHKHANAEHKSQQCSSRRNVGVFIW